MKDCKSTKIGFPFKWDFLYQIIQCSKTLSNNDAKKCGSTLKCALGYEA